MMPFLAGLGSDEGHFAPFSTCQIDGEKGVESGRVPGAVGMEKSASCGKILTVDISSFSPMFSFGPAIMAVDDSNCCLNDSKASGL